MCIRDRSKEYFTFWINKHVCDERFIDMAHFLGMKDASKPEDFITEMCIRDSP